MGVETISGFGELAVWRSGAKWFRIRANGVTLYLQGDKALVDFSGERTTNPVTIEGKVDTVINMLEVAADKLRDMKKKEPVDAEASDV